MPPLTYLDVTSRWQVERLQANSRIDIPQTDVGNHVLLSFPSSGTGRCNVSANADAIYSVTCVDTIPQLATGKVPNFQATPKAARNNEFAVGRQIRY